MVEIPFNITVQTRGLLEADDVKLASESLLSSHAVNHSRTLRCTDEVQFSFILSLSLFGAADANKSRHFGVGCYGMMYVLTKVINTLLTSLPKAKRQRAVSWRCRTRAP